MEPVAAIMAAVTVLFGAGGVWSFLAARATATANREAAQTAAAAANQQAATADWNGLMAYWQAELKALRDKDMQLEIQLRILERQREDDLDHIENLEQHIWKELPPPPPVRRRGRPHEEEP